MIHFPQELCLTDRPECTGKEELINILTLTAGLVTMAYCQSTHVYITAQTSKAQHWIMQDTNHPQGKVTTALPAAEDWIKGINSRCPCKLRKSALSTVLLFFFSQTIFEINFSMILFILCTYFLTSSSKLWANSGVKISWSQFQSCRNAQPTVQSRLTTMDHNSRAVLPSHGKIANFAFITHNPLPIPACFWSAPLTLCSHAQPLLFCDSPKIWVKFSKINGSLMAM